jgi:glycosyltransferase involved in cell wall biosynthesis
MRVALNLIGYSSGCGGVETYLLNLLAALQRIDQENNYLVLCDETAAPFLHLDTANFRLQTVSYQKHSIKGLLRGALQRITGYDILVRELADLDVDVMHHPLTVLNPPGLSYPSVLTFHDMQQEFFPDFFPSGELQRRRRSYLASVREASAIITVSAHASQCLVERYGVPPEKIHVVYSACGEDFHVRKTEELFGIAEEFEIRRPFMFYPAATWPHKNHLRLLEAVRLLLDRGHFDGDLLLTGAVMNAHQEVLEAINRLDLSSRVKWLGYVPRERVPCLYNLSKLLVFPSLFEGFGLPVVEAMASGCPVVCSQSSSLPEVGGNAAIYMNPLDVEDIAQKVSLVWNNEMLCMDLREKGLVQASRFSWDEAARKTADVYHRIAATGRPQCHSQQVLSNE